MTLQRKSFAEVLTFSAPGERTFFGSNGLLQTAAAGVPRFDYDPVTLAPKGILIEGTRQNLMLRSNQFDDAAWTKVRATVTANAATGPDGALSADKLVEDTSVTQSHVAGQTVSFVAGTVYSMSVVVEPAGRTQWSFVFPGSSFSISRIQFDLTAVTATTTLGAATCTIRPIGGGRFLCTATATATATGGGFVEFRLTSGSTDAYTGDGVSGVYFSCAQIEAGAFPSSYTPTTTMAYARAADILTVQPAQFAAAFRQDAGTILIDMTLNHTGLNSTGGNDFPFLLDMDSAAAPGDGYSLIASAGYGPGFRLSVTTGAADQASFTIAKALGGGSRTKLALSWGGANDFAACMDGGAVQTDTSGTLPTPDRLSIGCQNGSNNQMFGHVRKVLFFPQRLTNAQLQEATA